MEIGVIISLGVILVGLLGVNSNRISKLDDRIDEVPEKYLMKKDFDKFDTRLFEELKQIKQDIREKS